MKNDMFRKEAVEKITGPEDLNSYVKALNPRVWLILRAIQLLKKLNWRGALSLR